MRPSSRFVLLLAVAAACGRSDTPKSRISVNTNDAPRPADDLAILTHDGGVVLGVRHDTVRVRLSDSARAAVKHEVNKEISDSSKSGIGAFIAEKVGGAIAKTMDLEVSVPVSEIKSVAREDSSIRFVMRDGSKGIVFGGNEKSKGIVGRFAPADADKFVSYLSPKLAP